MPTMKLEVLFVSEAEDFADTRLIGSLAIDSTNGMIPSLALPTEGEYVSSDLPSGTFKGIVVRRLLNYSQTDLSGNLCDVVVRHTIIVRIDHELSKPSLVS